MKNVTSLFRAIMFPDYIQGSCLTGHDRLCVHPHLDVVSLKPFAGKRFDRFNGLLDPHSLLLQSSRPTSAVRHREPWDPVEVRLSGVEPVLESAGRRCLAMVSLSVIALKRKVNWPPNLHPTHEQRHGQKPGFHSPYSNLASHLLVSKTQNLTVLMKTSPMRQLGTR